MFTWTPKSTPFDGAFGEGQCCIRLPSGRQLIGASYEIGEAIAVSDNGGATWTVRSSPFDAGQVLGLAFSAPLGQLVAVGLSNDGSVSVAYSTDEGDTWTASGDPFGLANSGYGACVVWDDGEALFVAGADNLTTVIVTAADASAGWTPQTTPLDGNGVSFNGRAASIIRSSILSAWVAVGRDGANDKTGMTSADAAAWAVIAVGPFPAAAIGQAIVEDTVAGKLIAGGYNTATVIATSTDGATWAAPTSPLDGSFVNGLASLDGTTLAVGQGYTMESLDGGLIWTSDPTSMFASPGNGFAVCFTTDNAHALGVGYSSDFSLTAESGSSFVGPPTAPDPPTLDSATPSIGAVTLAWSPGFDGGSSIIGYNIYRGSTSGSETLYATVGAVTSHVDTGVLASETYFYQVTAINAVGESSVSNELSATLPLPRVVRFQIGHQWRFVVTELDMTILTFLDRLAENRMVVYTLNAPAVATGQVPSDNPEVNILAGDGDPLVSYSNRLLFGFRREAGTPPWVCRFAGILMQLEDAATTDVPSSLYTAYDPWQYLLSRPIRDQDLALPGPKGLTFDGADTTLDQIAYGFIANTVIADGTVYTDLGGGTIETIPFSGTINFQQGTSVGDALTQICNLGLCDIWFSPLYDPAGNPDLIARLNIYVQQGATRSSAIFAWDAPSKSLVGISRLLDGAQLGNEIQFYNGQGGPPVTLQTGGASVAKFGEYWAQQFFPVQTAAVAVESMAAQQLLLRQLGRRTVAINPAPERSPDPFTEYFLGDLCPIYATKRLRQTLPAPGEATNYTRIYGIPVTIPNDAPETVQQLLTSPDGFTP